MPSPEKRVLRACKRVEWASCAIPGGEFRGERIARQLYLILSYCYIIDKRRVGNRYISREDARACGAGAPYEPGLTPGS
jgi:hypothetical protein